MSTSRFAIEELLDNMDVKYFSRVDDQNSQWVLLTETGPIMILLMNDGESLCFHSTNLVDLSILTPAQLQQLQADLLQRNHLLITGHFSIHNGVFFECSIALKDASITQMQMEHHLRVTLFEMKQFQEYFQALRVVETRNGQSMEHFMAALQRELERFNPGILQQERVAASPASPKVDSQSGNDGHQDSYRVVLTATDKAPRLEVVKCIKKYRHNLSLYDCTQIVDAVPAPVGDWSTRPEAEQVVAELAEIGARAVII